MRVVYGLVGSTFYFSYLKTKACVCVITIMSSSSSHSAFSLIST